MEKTALRSTIFQKEDTTRNIRSPSGVVRSVSGTCTAVTSTVAETCALVRYGVLTSSPTTYRPVTSGTNVTTEPSPSTSTSSETVLPRGTSTKLHAYVSSAPSADEEARPSRRMSAPMTRLRLAGLTAATGTVRRGSSVNPWRLVVRDGIAQSSSETSTTRSTRLP